MKFLEKFMKKSQPVEEEEPVIDPTAEVNIKFLDKSNPEPLKPLWKSSQDLSFTPDIYRTP